MKNLNSIKSAQFLLIPIIVFTLTCSVSANSKKENETFYEQLTRAVVRIEEHQSICTPGLEWAYEQNIPVGTAFFVEDKFEGNSKFYIVTARHVVDSARTRKRRADLFARVRIDSISNRYLILVLPKKLWVFHPLRPKPGYLPVDVAVMQIQPTNFIKSFVYCENKEDCGKDKKEKQLKNQLSESPNVMDRAIFFGFPGGDVAKISLEPFARAGVVAYTAFNPDARIDGKLIPDDSIYYVDSPSFPGNSGGPVLREPLPLKGGVHLWGLITGGNLRGRDYAIVTRPEKIIETIKYARSVAKLNKNGWQKGIPQLPIKCEMDTKETK